MEKTKTQKGITLIALIITIVVLLILAVVAIGAAQESNIVGYAQNATSRYTEEQDKEVNMLATYESLIESINGPWSKLSVPVQYDKKYSNYITADGETQFVEITLYSTGGINLFGEEATKEEVEEAIKEGYIKVSSNAIELGETKFIFSTNGKQIDIYVEGNKLGTLDVEEIIPGTREWTTYGMDEMYFLVGKDIAYAILQGNLLATYTIETGTLEGSNEYKDYTIPENVRGASKILISNQGNIGAVIMPDGTFYAISLTNNKVQSDLIGVNSNIDYSSILEQIQ